MVKIFSIRAIWVGDDNVYKNLRPLEPGKWGNATLEKQKRGESLEMVWAIDSGHKPIADFIMFPGAGLASTRKLINHFSRFVKTPQTYEIRINGEESPYALLRVTNHQPNEMDLPHIFMMFRQYKYLLVTQLVKEEWDRLNLTGAVFEEEADMPDECFILVKQSMDISAGRPSL